MTMVPEAKVCIRLSQNAATPATSVLVTRPDSITWLSFDGDGWTFSEPERVASIALARLTA